MPYGNEVGEVGTKSAFAVAVEPHAAVDTFDSTGCAMDVVEEVEEMRLNVLEVGAAFLKFLNDVIRYENRFAAITTLSLILP